MWGRFVGHQDSLRRRIDSPNQMVSRLVELTDSDIGSRQNKDHLDAISARLRLIESQTGEVKVQTLTQLGKYRCRVNMRDERSANSTMLFR